ncbi:MAG: DUF481 domain-containing protein [Bdellovibrionaceae bacterium]|nr:DUF481 domain-containing protein [Pseudobdellovibrionaceae bacterium]
MKYLLSVFVLLGSWPALAADIFIADTIKQSGATRAEADSVHQLVNNTVVTMGQDKVVQDEMDADYTLQPRLMKLGESYILTVERRRGEEIIYASQVKANSVNELDRASRRATMAALSDRSVRGEEEYAQGKEVDSGTRSGATAEGPREERPQIFRGADAESRMRPGYQLNPGSKTYRYWSLGLGPALMRRVETDDLFYSLSAAHLWDIHPRASVKVLGEANFSTGTEDASMYNLAAGASWFFMPTANGAAYVTGDLGYGFAESALNNDADGFTFGTGVGYQFFRTSRTTMDVLLRYAVLTNELEEDGFPQLIGARLAVNF